MHHEKYRVVAILSPKSLNRSKRRFPCMTRFLMFEETSLHAASHRSSRVGVRIATVASIKTFESLRGSKKWRRGRPVHQTLLALEVGQMALILPSHDRSILRDKPAIPPEAAITRVDGTAAALLSHEAWEWERWDWSRSRRWAAVLVRRQYGWL